MLGRTIVEFFEKQENTINKFDKNVKVDFYYGKKHMVFAILGIIIIISCIIASIVVFRGDTNGIIIMIIFFSLFLLINIFLLLIVKNKKIEFFKGEFKYISPFKKEKKYNIKDICDVKYPEGNGTNLIFNNEQKLKFNPFLTNYKILDEILKDNKITKN